MRSDALAPDRRRVGRRTPADDEPLSRVRLRAGRDLLVIDVSNAGALVEGAARLLPGTHVDVHMVTRDGRLLVRGRVVRAYVSRLEPTGVHYRGAVAFESAVDTAAADLRVPDVLAPPATTADAADHP